MNRGVLLKFFPVPEYLALSNVGLDISDQSIKFAELVVSGDHFVLGAYGEESVPLGAIESGRIKKPEVITSVLKELQEKHNLKYVTVSLPEEQAYTVNLNLPYMFENEIRGSIELQLEELVPIPPNRAIFDYEIIERPKNNQGNFTVVVYVLPQEIVTSYLQALEEAGLKPVSFEVEAQAQARAILVPSHSNSALIIDVGKTRTSLSICRGQTVLFTSTINGIGGDDFSKCIQKSMGVTYDEAERIKIERGLLRSTQNKDLFYTLVPIISSLKDEISKLIEYWSGSEHSKQGGKIEEVYLCGGQASLVGLAEYLSSHLKLPVKIGNTWENVSNFNDYVPEVDFRNSLRYTISVGLALKNIIEHD